MLFKFLINKLLECSGNLYDACALAVKFALFKTNLPKIVIKSDDEGKIEIDFCDPPKYVSLNAQDMPYAVSVFKIGHNFIVDPDLKEESVSKVHLTFGFDVNGNIRYVSKNGYGSLDPDTLYSIIDVRYSLYYF